jgi:phenylacetate-CoA ligase
MFESPLYFKSPLWAQEVFLSMMAQARKWLREGAAFERELADVTRTAALDHDALQALQLARMQAVVSHAIQHVPYYRQIAKDLGLAHDFVQSLADIEKLPFLTKSIVFNQGNNMLSEVAKGPRFSATTSGTTGMPMTAYRDLHAINRENAFVWRCMMWAGLHPGEPRVWIRGDKIVAPTQVKPPFWRYVKADNMLMMSSYHLSDASATGYIDAIERMDPVVIQGYPSAVLLLARYMLSTGRTYKGKRLRSVVTSSETVTTEHRELVQRAFGCKIIDWYGCMERMLAIGNCEHGTYHVMSDYSHVEFLPQDDGTHEVVGTGFDNQLMPFIRYRLGDSVVLGDPKYRCKCGRAFPVVEQIIGRVEDYVLTPSGRKVFMMSNMLDNLTGVLEGQIRQDEHGAIKVLLVPAPGHGPVKVDEVVKCAQTMLGTDMRVDVQEVQEIPRTRNGKVRVVVRTI